MLVTASSAAAQVTAAIDSTRRARRLTDVQPFSLLARPSHIVFLETRAGDVLGWPDSAYYEGDVRIPAYMYSRTSALRSFVRQERQKRSSGCLLVHARDDGEQPASGRRSWRASGCTMSFTPHFVVRQLSDESATVRRPSFNPALDFSYYRLYAHGDSTRDTPPLDDGVHLVAASARAAHYSNGQSGCFYAAQTLEPDQRCTPAMRGPDRLNTLDGSFSTHYLEGALTYGRLWINREGFDRTLAYVSLAERWYPNVGAGGMDGVLAELYSRTNTSLLGDLRHTYVFAPRWLSSRFHHRQTVNVGVEGDLPAHRPDGWPRHRGAVYASLSTPGAYGLGVIVRHAWGWDYYNIGFRDRVTSGLHFGLVIQHAAPVFFGETFVPTLRR